jgi:hypothetical protein
VRSSTYVVHPLVHEPNTAVRAREWNGQSVWHFAYQLPR